MKRFALGIAIGLAAGFGVARLVSSPPAPAVPHQRAIAPRAEAAPACAPGVTAEDLAALADELRDELRADRAPPATERKVEAEVSDEPPVGSEAAAADAADLVATALDSGVWTEADAARLRELGPRMAPVDLDHVLSAVATAINDQRLKPTGPFIL